MLRALCLLRVVTGSGFAIPRGLGRRVNRNSMAVDIVKTRSIRGILKAFINGRSTVAS